MVCKNQHKFARAENPPEGKERERGVNEAAKRPLAKKGRVKKETACKKWDVSKAAERLYAKKGP